jgi:hypothetical protein
MNRAGSFLNKDIAACRAQPPSPATTLLTSMLPLAVEI